MVLDQMGELVVDDREAGTRVVEDPGDLAGAQANVDRDEHETGGRNGERRLQHRGGVGAEDCDPVARLETGAGESSRQALGALGELAVGDAPALVDDSRSLRKHGCAPAQEGARRQLAPVGALRARHQPIRFVAARPTRARAARTSGSFRSRSSASSPNSTAAGHLKCASRSRQKSMISPSVAAPPGFSVTNAFGRSPHFSSGIATTAHSSTARMARDGLLDLDRRDVLAAGDDDVLRAVAELDVAVRVMDREIARVEPPAAERIRRRVLGCRSSPSSRCCPRITTSPSVAPSRGTSAISSSTTRRCSAVTYATPCARESARLLVAVELLPAPAATRRRCAARTSRSARRRARAGDSASRICSSSVGDGGAPATVTVTSLLEPVRLRHG